jgi:dimethylargininase
MLNAITRRVSPFIANCELTYITRQPIDFEKAREQHQVYEQRLRELGLKVVSLADEPRLADCVFVEDTAIVVDEVAVITHMGAATRRPEVKATAETLSNFRPLKYINDNGTLEGGDVMRIGRTFYVGVSTRTNRDGISQLQRILEPYDYQVVPVEVTGCLHLKTACTYLNRGTILTNPSWADISPLRDFEIVETFPTEQWSANSLLVGDSVLLPASAPRTADILRGRGFNVVTVDISELEKAEAGLTCMSIIFS